MKFLTAAEMREADRQTTERYGTPSLTLMENAGSSVAEFLAERFTGLLRRRIVVLCGRGNNGGDGLVAARRMKDRGVNPVVILFASPDSLQGDAATNLKRWRDAGGEVRIVQSAEDWARARSVVASAKVLVDALLGTGLRGPLEGLLAGIIDDLNHLKPRPAVVAIDIPSGLSSDDRAISGPAVFADYTITFTAPKLGQMLYPGAERVGRLLVRQIGTPGSLVEEVGQGKLRWAEISEFSALPLKRKPDSHKGDYGHALVIAGSLGKTGAAVLAGWSALRAGAGLATVGAPENVLSSVATPVPELMTEPLAATAAGTISKRCLEQESFWRLLVGKSVLAIGPGLSAHPETCEFIRAVVADCKIPLIVDADGLNAFAGHAGMLARHRAPVLAVTPHPGEMARLLGWGTAEVQAQRLDVALRAAAEWKTFVVLKGHRTIVAAEGQAWVNSTGNPGMATAGAGDVLTGVLAGLTAQYGASDWARVLAFGVYLHGLAGDLAAEESGEASLMASDLILALPRAFAKIAAESEVE